MWRSNTHSLTINMIDLSLWQPNRFAVPGCAVIVTFGAAAVIRSQSDATTNDSRRVRIW